LFGFPREIDFSARWHAGGVLPVLLVLNAVSGANPAVPADSRAWMLELCPDGNPPDARSDAPVVVIEDEEFGESSDRESRLAGAVE